MYLTIRFFHLALFCGQAKMYCFQNHRKECHHFLHRIQILHLHLLQQFLHLLFLLFLLIFQVSSYLLFQLFFLITFSSYPSLQQAFFNFKLLLFSLNHHYHYLMHLLVIFKLFLLQFLLGQLIFIKTAKPFCLVLLRCLFLKVLRQYSHCLLQISGYTLQSLISINSFLSLHLHLHLQVKFLQSYVSSCFFSL